MPNPPKSTPHSDLDGVHRDEKTNIETSIEAGQDSGTLADVEEEKHGRPEYSDDRPAGKAPGL